MPSRLPAGIKLAPGFVAHEYTVLRHAQCLGTVIQRTKSYNIHPKAFTMIWWEAKLQGQFYPLGVDPSLLLKTPARDQVTKFPTRAAAIDALTLATPSLDVPVIV